MGWDRLLFFEQLELIAAFHQGVQLHLTSEMVTGLLAVSSAVDSVFSTAPRVPFDRQLRLSAHLLRAVRTAREDWAEQHHVD